MRLSQVDDRPQNAAAEPDARRRPTAWDLLGLLTAAAVMLGVHLIATALIDTPLGHVKGALPAAVLVALAATALLAVVMTRDRPRLVDVPGLVTGVWRDPPGHWVAAVTGALLAVPLFSLYIPVLLNDADSARVVSAVGYARENGIGFIVETQDNLLPYVIVGPAVALGGITGAKAVSIFAVIMLTGVTAYLTRRITGSMLGAVAAALALLALPAAVDRAGYVPMYATMLILGYLGAWLASRAVTEFEHPWRLAVAAGICLALTPEAQAVGVLFLTAPVLVLVLARDLRQGVAATGRIYLTIVVVSLPRLVLNLSSGGLERLASYRTDYWITKGYVGEIQRNFWGYEGVSEPFGTYMSLLPGRFVDSLGPRGGYILGAAALAWLLATRGRGRLLGLAVAGVMLAAVTVKQVPPFPRYYAPLWPGMAILVGVGIAKLASDERRMARAATAGALLALVVTSAATLNWVTHLHDGQRAIVDARPYSELAALIDDDRGAIGARSHLLMNVTTDTPTWGGQFLHEDEYVTYLTWPSDTEVIELLERHDIGWVIIHGLRQLENGYHDTWLLPHHGLRTRHVERLAASPEFCQVADIDGYLLYRLGGCP